ncbi:MAG: lysine--tRNA ligase [Dehalococcoidia bacterium]
MPEEDLLRSRQEKLERLRQRGIDPYPPRYHRSHTIQEAVAAFRKVEKANPDLGLIYADPADPGNEQKRFSVAGRITLMRPMGKLTFLTLRDGTGRIQALFSQDALEKRFALLKELDLGDFLGIAGPIMRTRTGEVTVEVREFTILAKALRPPPEKWHGLRDVEKRYRQRHLDLIANPETRKAFLLRSRVINAVRTFLKKWSFLEVDTPILVPVAAGALARPFVTHHHALDQTLYLRIATELYLKRLIVGGLDRVYELGRVFRNEGVDQDHNPEFTLLESYEAYADYQDVMHMVEEMVATVAQRVLGKTQVEFEGHTIDLTSPWQRLSLREALYQRTGIDIEQDANPEALARQMRELGIEVTRQESRGRLIEKLLTTLVEPQLVQPTFLLDYPAEMSPLAKAKPDNPRYVERFEGFVGGMELANAYTELNDPVVQRQRFLEQEELRRRYQDEELERLDEEFLLALEHGMPPTGGLGMGIDRLVMLLTGQRTIRDVLLFPQMRSKQP